MIYHGVKYTQELVNSMVADGMVWLDAHREHMADVDWVRDIDLGILNIADGKRCIFGQLFTGRSRECGCLDGWEWATSHGLISRTEGYALGLIVSYDHEMDEIFHHNVALLNEAWKTVIADLRAAEAM